MSEKSSREKGEFAPPGQRGGREGKPQHTQLPAKKRQDARRYKSEPKRKRDSKMYYHLVCKRNPKCMQRREEYRHNPEKYKRRKTPLREAALMFAEEVRRAGDVILFDQENPSNREIKQPGDNVGYEATSPSHYRVSPDQKQSLPSSHELPNQHHDNASPATSRVVPDSMKTNLQESLTYVGGGQHINAAGFSPGNLPPGYQVEIIQTNIGKGGWKVSVYSDLGEKIAHISFSKPLGVGPCLGAYEVQNSWSEVRGLGPFVYDIALELAGSSGLMSDRRSVSEGARKVWEYYLERRPDVVSVFLDNIRSPSNADPDDDCLQSSSGFVWQESPTSRVYYKKNKRFLQELQNLGVLRFQNSPRRKSAAALISEIESMCSQDLIEKSKGVKYSRKSIRPNGMSIWEAQGSKGESYTVRVKPAPKTPSQKIIAKMPVLVSCTCPFFRWQGPEHWAKTQGYLYGKPEGSATKPSKKDPSGKHWACKHVLAVLSLVKKQRIASAGDFTWDGRIEPFPEDFPSAREVLLRWASERSEDSEILHRRGIDLEKRIRPSWKRVYPLKRGSEIEIRHYPPDKSNPYDSEYGKMIAWDSGVSIGWLNLSQPSLPEHAEEIAFDISVSPEYRRLGVATSLLKAVKDLFGRDPIPSSYGFSRHREPTQDAQNLWKSWSRNQVP